MKRILLFLSALFIATTAIAHTIHWYVGGSVYHTTTCESGENVTPPTVPEKYGYTFRGWDTYAPIEYLHIITNQYIDPQITLDNTLRFELDIAMDYKNVESIFGVGGAAQLGIASVRAWGAYNYFTISIYPKSYTPCDISVDTKRHFIVSDMYKNKLQIDQCSITMDEPFPVETTNYKIYLGAYSQLGSVNYQYGMPGKYYRVKFYKRDFLIRDMIPVLDKDGVPCMYDKVERKFYYNAGTGDFIAGPIIGE